MRTLEFNCLQRKKVVGCKPLLARFMSYNNQWVVEYSGRLKMFHNPYRAWRYYALIGTPRYAGRIRRW